jgi:hypothetical protein
LEVGAAALLLALLAIPAALAAQAEFQLRSPAFENGGEIPARYTCEGGNTSPPLAWSDPPPGTKSFALILRDPDVPDPAAPRMTWIHWVVYAIPAEARSIDEAAGAQKAPGGGHHARNDWKKPDYGGPCPPIGRHRYHFTLYALDLPPSNFATPPHATLWDRLKGHVIGKAELMGTYQKTAK